MTDEQPKPDYERCKFEELKTHVYRCKVCGIELKTKSPLERLHSKCEPRIPDFPTSNNPFITRNTTGKEKARVELGMRETGGPGTELKRLLKTFGITQEAGCDCDSRASLMDLEGIDWCEENLDIIIGWLKTEAKRRNLLFSRAAAKILVKLAIRKARKKRAVFLKSQGANP